MKTGLPTINQLIGLLEKAKQQRGGACRVRVYDYHGEVILPKSFDEGSTMRGNHYFEWLAFSEEDQP
jgi:hypothetical protein